MSNKMWGRGGSIKRRIIRERGSMCENCGTRLPPSDLVLHHVKTRKERPDLLLDRDNMELLCPRCHNIRHGIRVSKYDFELEGPAIIMF